MLKHFDQIVLDAVMKCYGVEFRQHFNEWHRPKELRIMSSDGIDFKKEVRERTAMIRMVKKNANRI